MFGFNLKEITPRHWIIGVLVMGFFVTFLYALYFQIEPVVDARGYVRIALNIASGEGYRFDPSVPLKEDLAISFMGPGYQYFLGSIFTMFGQSLSTVWFIQSLLHIATGLLLFLVARNIFKNDWAGIIAAGLYIFNIDLIQMSAMTMTETLTLFLLTVSIFLFIRFYQTPSYITAASVGIAAAAATMTRPTMLLILVIIVLAALVRRYFKYAVVIFACALFVIGPWLLRNYIVYDKFVFTTAAGGYGLWLGNNPHAEGGAHPTPEIKEYAESHNFIETSSEGVRQVKNFAFSQPLQFIKIQIYKATAYFSVARPYAFWFYLDEHPVAQKIVLLLSIAGSSILFVSGISGAWLLAKSRESIFRWIIAFAVAMPLVVIPILVETRYRLPLYPFLALFGGYFFVQWHKQEKDIKFLRIPFFALLFMISTTLFDILRKLPQIINKLSEYI